MKNNLLHKMCTQM